MLRPIVSIYQFKTDQSGSTAIIFALSLTGLLAASGAAIDLVRVNSAQTSLYSAMDSAVLAGTKELIESGKPSAAIKASQDYFANNLDGNNQFSSININFKLNSGKNGIAAFGTAKVKPSLLSLFGMGDVSLASTDQDEIVSAVGTPPGGVENLEVSLMLDVTGSMCNDGVGPCSSGSKMSALKDASNTLLNKLLPVANDDYTVKVALVPFATRVRLAPDGSGGGITSAVTGLDPTWSGYFNECISGSGSTGSETSGNWTCSASQISYFNNWKIIPCVTDRYMRSSSSFGLTDAAPANGTWLNAHGGDRTSKYNDIDNSLATMYTGNSAADPAYHWNYNPNGNCDDIANGNAVVPLTDNLSKLQSAISGLSGYGATAGVLGTAFSWYALSPNWAGIWGGDSEPRPYSELEEIGDSGNKKLRKIAVLMTDGGYNTYTASKGNHFALLSPNAKSMCDNMKDSGIEIFTVGFSLNTLPNSEEGYARDTLSNCASDANHFIDAASSQDLVKAFDDIATTLVAGNIRLVK